MSLTRTSIETVLVKRAGKLMTAVGMAVTFAGSNADLNDPIGFAIRKSGYPVSDIASVSDTDLASVGDSYTDQLLDVAELRLLENILGNLDKVDMSLGPESQSFSQLSTQLETRITRLSEKVADEYGLSYGQLQSGVIDLAFQQRDLTTL